MNINVSSPVNHSARNICSDTDIHKLQYNVKMQICTGATGGKFLLIIACNYI